MRACRAAFYLACGYVPAGPRALRADRAERFAAAARRGHREGRPLVLRDLAGMAGCPPEEVEAILAGLGFVRDSRRGLPRARPARR